MILCCRADELYGIQLDFFYIIKLYFIFVDDLKKITEYVSTIPIFSINICQVQITIITVL